MIRPPRLEVLGERNYRIFLTGYAVSFTLFWVTILAVGWWTWAVTGSAAWVGAMYFCELFPALLVTPWAGVLADRGDRFRILKRVLWAQVATGAGLAGVAWAGLLTPPLLAVFVTVEGALIGISQPAFFGMVNRLVRKKNLPAAVAVNIGVGQTSYVVGPLLAALVFGFTR